MKATAGRGNLHFYAGVEVLRELAAEKRLLEPFLPGQKGKFKNLPGSG